jgi:hypothetical protein
MSVLPEFLICSIILNIIDVGIVLIFYGRVPLAAEQ